MSRLNAGYFIEEVDELLKGIAGEEYAEFSRQINTTVQITGLPDSFDPNAVQPSVKVLHNIFCRSDRLAPGSRIAEYVLNSNLGMDVVEWDEKNSKLNISLSTGDFSHLNMLNFKYILKNISSYTDDKIIEEFGEEYTSLFNVLFDLRAAAQIQHILIRCLILGENKVQIDGISEKLAKELTLDLNDWIESLNNLLSEDEEAISPINLSNDDDALTLYYAYDPGTARTICTVLNYEDNRELPAAHLLEEFGNGVLTGRSVKYTGVADEKSRASLNFILQNIFGESELDPREEELTFAILPGTDRIACLPEGVDTVLSWQLYAMLQPGVVLVLEEDPARMNEQMATLLYRNISRVGTIPSSATGESINKRLRELEKGRYQILIVSPDLLHTETFGSVLCNEQHAEIRFSSVIMNDIQRVSEWSGDFRSSYLDAARKIGHYCHDSEDMQVPTIAFSSSATYDVLTDIYRELDFTDEALFYTTGAEGHKINNDVPHGHEEPMQPMDPRKEKEMVKELLTIVRYEHQFFMKVLVRSARKEFPKVGGLKLGENRYLYAHGPVQKVKKDQVIMGLLDLEDKELKNYDKVRKNFDLNEALLIMNHVRKDLIAMGDADDYAGWLKRKTNPGIAPRLHGSDEGSQELIIGLKNDIAGEITNMISDAGNKGFNESIVLEASSKCCNGNEFVDQLISQYRIIREENGKESTRLELSEEMQQKLADMYYQLRTPKDTQKAMYRLRSIGIIDSFSTDYQTGSAHITFHRKEVKDYYMGLQMYIRQYFGRKSTEKWMQLAMNRDEENFLIAISNTAIEFTEEEIQKRVKLHSENATEQEPAATELNIFASDSFLPLDTESGKKSNAEIVDKYLKFITSPPDKRYSEMSTVRQLKDACKKMKEDCPDGNSSIDLLMAFSMFALDVKVGKLNGDARKRAVAEEAMGLYMDGIDGLQKTEDWKGINDLMKELNEQIFDLNPITQPLVDPMMTGILLKRTNDRLKTFLKRTGISS